MLVPDAPGKGKEQARARLSAAAPLRPQVTYGSFDYTSLLYLSDYRDDFGGGRFVFMEEGANKTVEPRAGGRASGPGGGWGCARAGLRLPEVPSARG